MCLLNDLPVEECQLSSNPSYSCSQGLVGCALCSSFLLQQSCCSTLLQCPWCTAMSLVGGMLTRCSPKVSWQNATCPNHNSCLAVCTAALTAGSNPIGTTVSAHIPNVFGVEETVCQAGAQGLLGTVQEVSCMLCPVLPAPCYGSSDA